MIKNYLTYLEFITNKLNKFFNRQKDYIFCKPGCALCCKDAEFPYSAIEMEYLLEGFETLSEDTKNKIANNIKEILKQKKTHKEGRFVYDCPFLINDVCSVYDYRGIVCRSFGLMSLPDSKHSKVQVPFCCYKGLNYSNVMDPKTDMISSKMYIETGIKEEPASFNVSYETLTSKDIEEAFYFKFGPKKPMIEWFEKLDETSKTKQ